MGKIASNQRILSQISNLGLQVFIGSIKLYQATLSPDHGALHILFPRGACRYFPSCSQYMIDALSAHGWRGVLLGIKRIGRCHPFAEGGFDPVITRSARPKA